MNSENYILGNLLAKLGISFEEAIRIVEGNIKLEKSPETIRNYILENCSIKISFLRNLYNSGINLQDFSSLIFTDYNNLMQNLDNNYFWINTIDFKAKNNIELRRNIVNFLAMRGLNSNKIANLLDVSPSAIQNDRNIFPVINNL